MIEFTPNKSKKKTMKFVINVKNVFLKWEILI